ncbi:DUF4333 domain-containing protein [Mycobacterium sp. Y57]|nr:DUF4333 domain-containing protein [Mycolicibacterium xanthum]
MMKVIGALVALLATPVAVVACTVPPADRVPTVASGDLQSDIAKRLSDAGVQPQSVNCAGDLVGEVGQTARCEVVIGPTNSFEPIVLVTAVDGATIDYQMTPALSKGQLERAVSRLLADREELAAAAVACPAGLVGRTGAQTRCDVTVDGATVRRTAEVTEVEGLMMTFDVIPILTRVEVEGSLLGELTQQLGRRPDSAECAGDLEGRPGNTVECTVAVWPASAVFVLTVTAVDGQHIDYTYARRE